MALSLDLRQRAVEAYERGDGPVRAVAARFGVGHASLSRWLGRNRTTGSPERAPRAGGTPRRIGADDEARLKAWLADAPSTSQHALAARLAEATGRPVCQQTVSRAIRRIGWTRKKSG